MKFALILLFTSVLLFSCKSAAEKDRLRREGINNLIRSVNTYPVTQDRDLLSGKPDSITTEVVDGREYTCAYEFRDLSQTIDGIVAFNPTAGVLYPGSLVKGKSLEDGILNPINVARNGGKLTISYIKFEKDLVTKKEISYTDSVSTASFQPVKDAVERLTDRLPAGNQVSILSLEKTEAHSLEESFLRLGVSAKWLAGSARAQLNQSFRSSTSKYFVKVIQQYYVISFETNYSQSLQPADFFRGDIDSIHVITSWDRAKNPLTYVKSISYGRILMMFIESSSSQADLTAALEATLSSATAKGKIDISAGQRTAIDNSRINLLSLGGASGAIVKLISGNKLDSLITYLQAGANFSRFSPGYPISYTSRYVKNDEAAKLSYSTSYKVKKCDPNPKKIASVTVNFLGIDDDKDDTEPIDFRVYLGEKLVGSLVNVGNGVEWDEGTNMHINIPINADVNEMQRSKLMVEIDKSNANRGGCGQGAGFRFARHTIDITFKDGSVENWFQNNNRFRLGNCDSKIARIRF